MLDEGIVSPSSSPWSSPMVSVPTRDGTHCICIDYRKPNNSSVKDGYPLPRTEDIFATLGKSKLFGIASAPAIFQRVISKVLHGIQGKYAMAYLDDILIYSDSVENHLKHIEDIFKQLEKADLCLNKNKCHFVKKEI